MTEHVFNAYKDSGLIVNGCPATTQSFADALTICNIVIPEDALTTLTIEDNDDKLNSDNFFNEYSDDQTDQTVDGIRTYVDYKLTVTDGCDNYFLYIVDVGQGFNSSCKDSYVIPDPDNMPPAGVTLYPVSWCQLGGVSYEDFEVPCFASGTVLRRSDGSDVLVENIKVGDTLYTQSGNNQKVTWVGMTFESSPMYSIYHPLWGTPVLVTENHGVAVRLIDGSKGLVAAKFLVDAKYGDFVVTQVSQPQTVHHIMLEGHELVVTGQGLVSESYYCGGWKTNPSARDVYYAQTSREEMDIILPRVKRKDVVDVISIITI